jgi:hypothetical protein
MKSLKRAAVSLAMILIVIPAMAGAPGNGGGNRCSPDGTWYGTNALGQNYLITVNRIGGGRYTAVAEGLNDPNFCDENGAFRGDLVRTGPNTYVLRQLLLCKLDGVLYLWASEGELVFTGCDHFDAVFDNIGVYLWAPGITPFVTPYDIPFIPPGDPLTAAYDRMPLP